MNVTETAEELAAQMSRQFRVRGGRLADVAARAGRKLPGHLRHEVETIVEAETLTSHPKLAYRVDQKRVATASRKLRRYLAKLDPAAERRAEILDRIAAVAFVIFAVALAAFFVLISRGYFD